MVSPSLDIYSVEAKVSNEIIIPTSLVHNESKEIIESKILLDSGAGGIFIDQNYVRKLHLETKMLETPVKAQNVDGTKNK